jgi:hypothetical protein
MKTYTLSAFAASTHKPEHQERTARRNQSGTLNFDIVFQTWSNRAAMARSIRMQERGEYRSTNWRACEPLTPGEGY